MKNPVIRAIDHLIIVYELVLSNKRLIFPTMIGLVLALTILAQNSIMINSYQSELFEETVSRSLDLNDADIRIQGTVEYPGLEGGIPSSNANSLLTSYGIFDSIVESAISSTGYGEYMSDYRWYTTLSLGVWVNVTYGDAPEKVERDYTELSASSEPDFYAEVASILNGTGNGRIPRTTDEVIMIRAENFPYDGWEWMKRWKNYTLGQQITFTKGQEDNVINKTVKIVGMLEYPVILEHYYYGDFLRPVEGPITNLLRKYLDGVGADAPRFLSTPHMLNTTISEFTETDTQFGYDYRMVGELCLDHSKFNAYVVGEELGKLKSFIRALEQEFYAVLENFYIYSPLQQEMEFFQLQIFGLIVVLLLVTFPVVAIALYLVVYSFGLVRKQYQDQIGIIKTRGGSSWQVFLLLLVEVVISTVIATGIGFVVSLIFTDIVMRSSDFLQFGSEPIPVRATVSMVQDLISWGIILAFLLNLGRIIRMSRQDITETQIPIEKRDPFWKRKYLDVFIFLIGTGTWVLMMTIYRQLMSGEEIAPLLAAIYPILGLLTIPAPFFMFFGTIMMIARTFPFLMSRLSDFFWQAGGGINAFSVRNIVRHKQAANRAVLLVTLALSFSILSSSLIFSMDESTRSQIYYAEGADVTLSDPTASNQTLYHIFQSNISHLTSISTTYFGNYETYGYEYQRYSFLFVDPRTYALTVNPDAGFILSSSLSTLMEELVDNQTVIIYEKNLGVSSMPKTIGENVSIRFENGSIFTETITFRVGGTFYSWPTLYPQPWYDVSRNFWLVGSLGMFERLNDSNYLNSISAKHLGKIDSESNLEFTVDQITNLTHVIPQSPGLAYRDFKTSFGRKFGLSILNTDLIACMAVSIIGIVMFAFFTFVERGKEIGVERALGMTRIQTGQSFLVEAIMILAFGALIGTVTGAYFVAMFLQVTQLGQTVPPMVVTYPIEFLINIILAILLAAGIGTVIPAYMATRRDISRILKVE
ncbi:MAG: FtsX-like permease family protein [Candidatus Thorarchaeota archaeon]